MAHAEICPVCKGKGEINKTDVKSELYQGVKKCHGCDGDGWVEVEDGGFPFIPCEPPAPIRPYLYENEQKTAADEVWRHRVWA